MINILIVYIYLGVRIADRKKQILFCSSNWMLLFLAKCLVVGSQIKPSNEDEWLNYQSVRKSKYIPFWLIE